MAKDLVITIARSYGSGGRTLAIKLSEELGIPFYDRDIIKTASEDSGISEEMFGTADEKLTMGIAAGPGKYLGKPVEPNHPLYTSERNLFELQAEAIKKLANQGSCIFVGRCADYILKSRENVISLFLYGTEQNCLERLHKQIGGDYDELLKRMDEINKRRAYYYKYYTGHYWNDAANYDLCLNTGKMTYDQLVAGVTAYIKLKEQEL